MNNETPEETKGKLTVSKSWELSITSHISRVIFQQSVNQLPVIMQNDGGQELTESGTTGP